MAIFPLWNPPCLSKKILRAGLLIQRKYGHDHVIGVESHSVSRYPNVIFKVEPVSASLNYFVKTKSSPTKLRQRFCK
jgi:hypothetical protein